MTSARTLKCIELAITNDVSACIQDKHTKNYTESTGQLVLDTVKTVTLLEAKALQKTAEITYDILQDPKMFIAALTIVSMASVTLAFYPPLPSCAYLLHNVKYLPVYQNAKYVMYLHAQGAVLGVGLRTLGRFSNERVMDKIDELTTNK